MILKQEIVDVCGVKMKYIILIVLLINQVGSVIYRLNDTEYLRMPPVYQLDDYEPCVRAASGTYCYADVTLVSDTPSDLLHMIQEYSEHTSTHFNHSKLHYGICVTKTCKSYVETNKEVDQRLILERCLNESMWRDYKLKTRLLNLVSCQTLNDPMVVNIGDICAAVAFSFLGLLNIVGSIYDYWFFKGNKGNKIQHILLSFSFKRNFENLCTHGYNDPLRERLSGAHGLRVLTIMLVITAHAPLPFILSTANPHGVEKTYYDVMFNVFYNGTLIVQTFFLTSGFFLAYTIRTYSENNSLRWMLIPKGIILRWVRLTPAYAIVLIFTLTWMRFTASGIFWEVTVGAEVKDCRRFGWLNLFYLNNYIDSSQCMLHTWYLAADMQLYILGLFVCFIAKSSRSRNIVLSVLFVIGCVIIATHTYVQDLDAIVVVSPEVSRNFFIVDPTFNHSYKRGHTNIPGMVLGLALGNLVYEGLRDEKRIKKYKKLGFLYNLTFPMGLALVLSGMVFYGDRPKMSIYLRTVLSAIIRPLFALLVAILFIGMVFKFEHVYRKILEWYPWRILARVSYSAYLIHVTIIRIFAGMNTNLLQYGLTQFLKEASGILFITFLLACPFWLFVEAPLNQVMSIIFGLSKQDKKDDEDQSTDKTR